MFWEFELPALTSCLSYVGIKPNPQWAIDATEEVEAFAFQMCKAAKAFIEDPKNDYSLRDDLLKTPTVYHRVTKSLEVLESQNPEITQGYQHDLLIASELLDHLAAGHETSGITLTYLFHELSQRPKLQAALRKELLTLTPPVLSQSSSASSLPSSSSIDTLSLLHAVIMETLRLHSAIPAPQPRITPSTPTSLAGSPPLPGGVRVSAQAYSLHRNEEVFPQPEEWRPERWLDVSKEQKDEMMRWFWAFGSGGRMCIGNHLAMLRKHKPDL